MRAKQAARVVESHVFPTPPFPEATAITDAGVTLERGVRLSVFFPNAKFITRLL
jgi:hypothetical protein